VAAWRGKDASVLTRGTHGSGVTAQALAARRVSFASAIARVAEHRRSLSRMRVRDENQNWRIVYRIDEDRILILDVFKKTTRQIPDAVIKRCRRSLGEYDLARRVQ